VSVPSSSDFFSETPNDSCTTSSHTPSSAIALNAMAGIAFPCAGGPELAAREIMENAVVSSKFRAW